MKSSTQPADRYSKRRAATREALLGAARRLFARRGIAETTIQEIADEANVGFGSFFNHFTSKETLRDAVLAETIQTFARAIQQATSSIKDPAERLAAVVKLTLRRADRDPEWGWFLVRTSIDAPALRAALTARAAADVALVWRRRSFTPARLQAAAVGVGGVVLASITARLTGQLGADAPELAAALALRLVDVPARAADRAARAPLPEEVP